MKIKKFLSKSYLGMMAVLRAQQKHRENDFTHIVLAMRRADRMRFGVPPHQWYYCLRETPKRGEECPFPLARQRSGDLLPRRQE